MPTIHEIMTGYFTEEQLERIENTHVFIAGCGGLGSNIAHALVRCGFIRLTLLDFDVLEAKNLNRQFFFPEQVGMKKTEALAENLTKINPELELSLITGRLEAPDDVPALTGDCDILVEAFDKAESKAVFVSGALPTGKPVIAASGIAGFGNTDDIVVSHPQNNLYLVGDGVSDVSKVPPLAPRVMLTAAKQANLVLEIVLTN